MRLTGSDHQGQHRIVWALASATLGLLACRGDPVPFKDPKKLSTTPSNVPDEAASPATAGPTPGEPAAALTYPDGTLEASIGEAVVRPEAGSLRSLLSSDLDGDGDADALFVAANASRVSLQYALADAQGFAAARPTRAELVLAAGCRLLEAPVRQLAAGVALVEIDVECFSLGADPGQGPVVPEALRDRETWIVATESPPRLLERLRALASARGSEQLAFQIAAEDHDADGHADLVVRLDLKLEHAEQPHTMRLVWLNRPGGLAREQTQPELTLSELAEQASNQVRRKRYPAALHSASQVLAIHRMLCRESDGALLQIGQLRGVLCGRSLAAGRAAAVRVAALAAERRVLETVEALDRLADRGYRVPKRDRAAAEKAFASLVKTPAPPLELPFAHSAPSAPEVRLSALAFLDEQSLLLRGPRPMLYHLESGQIAAATGGGSALVHDPSGRFAVSRIERGCKGYSLRVVPIEQTRAGVFETQAVSEPLLDAQPPPAGQDCNALPQAQRRDSAGFRVLGWTPRGIVVARGSDLRLVPMDEQARPRGPSIQLGPGAVLPSPLPAGQVTADGSHYLWACSRGIVLRRLGSHAHSELLVPAGWRPSDAKRVDLALSPSGSRIAMLKAGRVYVWQRYAPGTTERSQTTRTEP
ncbi:MAG: hypothetical protein MJD61_22590 [Proteobacteria bacterium]|nr:hypothetical protein [Pseudomonadota bacterium]